MEHKSPLHDHVPWFIPVQGQTDVLLVATAIFVVAFVLIVGVLMWRLHSLPMAVAQAEQKIQYQVVAVLCLLSLFTRHHLYWVAAMLLAMADLPDFTRPLERISTNLKRIVVGRQSTCEKQQIDTTPVPPAQRRTA
jgi:multisubunit Na+/H+ antiporter MnhF subunit